MLPLTKSGRRKKNSVLVESNGKEDSADGVFFKKGNPYNQGQIFTFDEDAFIDGCEKAIERYKASPENLRIWT